MSENESSISCVPGETVCYDNRGICDESTLKCVCRPEYSQRGDLIKITECSQHVIPSKFLYSTLTTVWCIVFCSALYACFVIKRKTARSLRVEVILLYVLMFSGVLYITCGLLVVTSDPYGERSVGNDLAATIIFCFATLLSWAFMLLKPFVSVSGLSSSMFTYTGLGKKIYMRMAPILVFAGAYASISFFFIQFSIGTNAQIVSSIFFVCGGIGTTLVLYMSYAIFKVRINITAALKAKPNIDQVQRGRLEEYKTRSTRLLTVAVINILFADIAFFTLAASWDYARKSTWVFFPIIFITNGLWVLRHVINNIRLSNFLRSQERLSAAKQKQDQDGLMSNNNLTEEGLTALTKVATKASYKMKSSRLLRAIKTKPLELMSVVSEGTAEGTVQFTKIESLQQIGTNNGF